MSDRQNLAALLAEKARRNPPKTFKSLESLMTDGELFALKTATPLQRAICRVADGLPLAELALDPDIVSALGGQEAIECLPNKKPHELAILSGIRVGKSLLAALLAIYWTQTCDVSRLGPGEIPRVSIVSVTKQNAQVVFDHIVGRIMASESLKKLLIGAATAESLMLRHPTGIPVEICVVSGSRAGSSLVSRWSAGCIFDEFPRMMGQDEGVINWNDSRDAVIDRILPGAQIVSIGSPWAPHGPAYDVYTASFGKPTDRIVMFKAPAWVMNPIVWTPEKIEQSKRNPDTYQTECLGEFASPEESLFAQLEIEGATRALPIILSPDSRYAYRAAMDPATRGNGWTFVVATRIGTKKKIVRVDEWIGSKVDPLKPAEVMKEIAAICREYGIQTVDSDIFLADAIKEIGASLGINVRINTITEREKAKKWMSIKTKFASQEIELPPDMKLRSDLLQLRKRATSNGIKIILPNSGDGRHCDFAPSLLMALSGYLEDAVVEEVETEEQRLAVQADRMRKQRFEENRQRLDRSERLRNRHR